MTKRRKTTPSSEKTRSTSLTSTSPSTAGPISSPPRISPTIAGCPIRLKTSSPSLAATRTRKRSVRTPAVSLAEAIGRDVRSIAPGYFFARRPLLKVTLLAQFPHTAKPFVFYAEAMTGRVEDWREKRQDERIDRLEGDLYEAREKIRELDRRPMEWLLRAELAIVWILLAAFWVFAIVEATSNH
jgi:hypothetical protein